MADAKFLQMVIKIETEIMFVYKNHIRVESDYVREENNLEVNLGGTFTTTE
jgi:hypothetical protein